MRRIFCASSGKGSVMSKFVKAVKLLGNPSKLVDRLNECAVPWLFSDRTALKAAFRHRIGKKLNFKAPVTFNEKLQWLKLYDRRPIYTTMVDKFAAKKYVADLIGEEYVVSALGGPWKSFDEIDFDSLPDKFVLKTNHDCGGVVICRDKATFDREKARAFLSKHLKRNYYWSCREWPYKNVKPCIFAEEFLEDGSGDAIYDYKFFCFGGEPKIMYLSRDRSEDPRTDFFDMDYNHLDMRMKDPHADVLPEKPERFEEMKRLAAVLSQGIPHVRVDFYMIGDRLLVGEMTFFHCGGFVSVKPESWNRKMGDWITLPTPRGEEV